MLSPHIPIIHIPNGINTLVLGGVYIYDNEPYHHSDKNLSLVQCQAITWANDNLLWNLEISFGNIGMEIQVLILF